MSQLLACFQWLNIHTNSCIVWLQCFALGYPWLLVILSLSFKNILMKNLCERAIYKERCGLIYPHISAIMHGLQSRLLHKQWLVLSYLRLPVRGMYPTHSPARSLSEDTISHSSDGLTENQGYKINHDHQSSCSV